MVQRGSEIWEAAPYALDCHDAAGVEPYGGLDGDDLDLDGASLDLVNGPVPPVRALARGPRYDQRNVIGVVNGCGRFTGGTINYNAFPRDSESPDSSSGPKSIAEFPFSQI